MQTDREPGLKSSTETQNKYEDTKQHIMLIRKYSCKLYIIILLGFITSVGFSQTAINVSEISPRQPIGRYMKHYYDPDKKDDIESIQSVDFEDSKKDILNFGYNTGADWLKFLLYNPENHAVKKIVRINKPILDSLELLYYIDGKLITQIDGSLVVDNRPFKRIKANYFSVDLPPGTTITCFLRATGMHSKQISAFINTEFDLMGYDNLVTIIIWFYLGALSFITLHNLFLGSRIKDTIFILFALSNLSTTLGTLTLKGFFSTYIFLNMVQVNLVIQPLFIMSVSVFTSLLCMEMVNARKTNKILYYMFWGVIVYAILAAIVPLVMYSLGYQTSFRHLSIATFVFTVTAVVSGVISVKSGNNEAKLYLIAWVAGAFEVMFYTLLLNGLIPINFFTENLYVTGSLIEVLLLSFALADRHRNILNEKRLLTENLQFKEQDLETIVANNIFRSQFKQDFLKKLENLVTKDTNQASFKINKLISDLKFQIKNEERQNHFHENIENVNSQFHKKLVTKYPDLTKSEIEICYLIKLQMSNKEIAQFRNSTDGAIKIARHRIRKKMELSDQDIDMVIQNL